MFWNTPEQLTSAATTLLSTHVVVVKSFVNTSKCAAAILLPAAWLVLRGAGLDALAYFTFAPRFIFPA